MKKETGNIPTPPFIGSGLVHFAWGLIFFSCLLMKLLNFEKEVLKDEHIWSYTDMRRIDLYITRRKEKVNQRLREFHVAFFSCPLLGR